MVGLEVVAEEREPQAAAPLERAVAGAGVAPEPAHQGKNMALEVGNLGRALVGEALTGGRGRRAGIGGDEGQRQAGGPEDPGGRVGTSDHRGFSPLSAPRVGPSGPVAALGFGLALAFVGAAALRRAIWLRRTSV